MFQLITTKGRKSADTLEALAAWLQEMQPSSVRIVWGDIEAEVECSDDEPENDLRWALRLEEANVLNLTIENDNIYLTPIHDAHPVYLRRDVACVTLVDDRSMITRDLRDDEMLSDVAAAVEREGRE